MKLKIDSRAASRELRFDAIVVGGGIAGLGVARALVLKRKKVLVINKPVKGASTPHASGILDPFVDLDFRPEILALTIPSVKKYPAWIRQIESLTGLQTGYLKNSLVYLAETAAEEKKLKRFLNIPGVKQKMDVSWVNSSEVRKLESQISPHVRGALCLRGVARIIPAQLLKTLKKWLELKGVLFLNSQQAPELLTEKGKAIGIRVGSRLFLSDCVIGCLGAWAGGENKKSKLYQPIEPIRGQVAIYKRKTPLKVLLHTADGGYLIPWENGKVLAGSTVEKVGFDARVTALGQKHIHTYAKRLLPELAEAHPVQTWAGIRPRSLSRCPKIGKTRISGYYVANGYYRCGILIGFYAGELLAQMIRAGKGSSLLKPFSPSKSLS